MGPLYRFGPLGPPALPGLPVASYAAASLCVRCGLSLPLYSVVCLCVCMLVTTVSCAKAAGPIEMLFGRMWTRGGTRNHTLRLGGGADFTTERGTVGSHAWAWPDMPAVDSLTVIRYGTGALRLLASGAAMRWVGWAKSRSPRVQGPPSST